MEPQEKEDTLVGGRLLYQGSYGCIFSPSLRCKPGTEIPLDTEEKMDHVAQLSKVLPAEQAQLEMEITQKIIRIPLSKNYFVGAVEACDPLPEPRQTEKGLSKCDHFDHTPLRKMKLLRMPYKGVSLYHVQFTPGFDIRSFVVHLLAGGALMNLFGVVHRDLHPGNILVDASFVPRIIDFNLAVSVSPTRTLPGSELSHKYDYTLSQEPPDSCLVNAIDQGYSATTVIRELAYRKPIMGKISSLLGISRKEMYEKCMLSYKTSRSIRTGDLSKWFQLYYRVVDSWAIGVGLVELIHTLMKWPVLASRIQDTVKELIPILRKMCAGHPMERIDCVQALDALDPNHVVVRRYGQKWLSIVGRPFYRET